METADEDRANALCFGCMALNEHADRLSEALSSTHPVTLVIHPRKAAIRFAKLLVKMGLSHSKKSYSTPIKEVSFPS